jgi:23S rRNA (cytosine1962-C5)-methyltransferase
MFRADQYELIDFGDGEKLENFGGVLVRREALAAIGSKSDPHVWQGALRFHKRASGSGAWSGAVVPHPWTLSHGSISLKLKPTPFGHLGLFPEQAINWSWINSLPSDLAGLKAINLFAYTGGTTLALAARGVSVSHVDSAKNIVNWARQNSVLSGLEDAPIRWLVEDALTFVRREIKRGNDYDIIVADPPSYGRGTRSETWKMSRDFDKLIELLAILARDRCQMILISCHTPDFDASRLRAAIGRRFELSTGDFHSERLELRSRYGGYLESGSCFRWSSSSL